MIIYKGTNKYTHHQFISKALLAFPGLQNIRKMTIGAKIAEIANGNGDPNQKAKALKVITENPGCFETAE